MMSDQTHQTTAPNAEELAATRAQAAALEKERRARVDASWATVPESISRTFETQVEAKCRDALELRILEAKELVIELHSQAKKETATINVSGGGGAVARVCAVRVLH